MARGQLPVGWVFAGNGDSPGEYIFIRPIGGYWNNLIARLVVTDQEAMRQNPSYPFRLEICRTVMFRTGDLDAPSLRDALNKVDMMVAQGKIKKFGRPWTDIGDAVDDMQDWIGFDPRDLC